MVLDFCLFFVLFIVLMFFFKIFWYYFICMLDMLRYMLIFFFGSKFFLILFFILWSKKGFNIWWSCCIIVFWFWFCLENYWLKVLVLLKMLGSKKLRSVYSLCKLFCSGVLVIRRWLWDWKSWMICDKDDFLFLIWWVCWMLGKIKIDRLGSLFY